MNESIAPQDPQPSEAPVSDLPPSDTDPKPKKKYAVQDKVITSLITTSYVQTQLASTDLQIRPIFDEGGWFEQDWKDGAEVISRAATLFDVRLEAMGDQDRAEDKEDDATAFARNEYARFRSIARAFFPESADQVTLGLTGEVPDDFDLFVPIAQASYQAGQKEAYVAELTRRKYPPSRLKTLSDQLDALIQAKGTSNAEDADAKKSTANRNDAAKALRAYMRKFKLFARGVLRDHPALKDKLKL